MYDALNELIEQLKGVEEVTLMEWLELDSEKLVEHCVDLIEDRLEDLQEKMRNY